MKGKKGRTEQSRDKLLEKLKKEKQDKIGMILGGGAIDNAIHDRIRYNFRDISPKQ